MNQEKLGISGRVSMLLLENLDLNSIHNVEQARSAIVMLFNLIEDLKAENRKLQEENQHLRDENNRLKGEQGKPDIKPNKRPSESAKPDHSSEAERRKPQERQKSSKLESIRIDREQVLTLDRATLPSDAQFKGYEKIVVQDILIRTDNIRFLKEKYYSPGEHKTYLAELPGGYQGQFGPGIKSLAIVQYFGCNMSEPKILEFFSHFGIQLSAGELSQWLTQGQPDPGSGPGQALHAEKESIYRAGLLSSPWHNIDDTGTRVNGQNHYCHILCNPLYTAYFTKARKDRLTVLDILRNCQARTFRLNPETEEFLRAFDLSERIIRMVQSFPQDQELSEGEFIDLLQAHLPHLGRQKRTLILDAVGVATYQTQKEWPVIKLLLCDDAPQFQSLTEELALCWVHEGRHYKKLEPYVLRHRQLLKAFLKKFWKFYDQLLAYRQDPTVEDKRRLSGRFNTLFSTVTGYQALDERIKKTRGKKFSLLMVLDHPEIPLHNNPAELGARLRVRKRDVSFGPRTPDGAKAWDTFMTIAATAKKLGVSFYRYIHDRVSGTLKLPSLADLIAEKAKQSPLGLSWDSS